MRFAKFAGEDGKAVFINPSLVTKVLELNDRLRLVESNRESVNIPLPINLVISDLEAAASKG
jgi:hypothetical protein